MSAWEDKLKKAIAPTESKWPYRVIQVKPNRKIDSEIYTLSGREEDIAANGSLFLALYDLAQRDYIDFKEWFSQWELGFPLFDQFREPGKSNYPLFGEQPWRVPDNRPKYKDWTPLEIRKKVKYRTIEYWRDRNNESESIVLSGTDAQLIQHIIQIEYEGRTNEINGKEKGGNWPPLTGQPKIKLFFRGKGTAKAEISIRVINKTDDAKIPLPKIDKSDLRNYANAIKQEFANPNLYVWQKGRKIISYKNRYQGFDGQWWLCRNEQEGRILLQKLVNILGFELDPARIRLSVASEELLAFPTNPPDEVVLGETVSQQEKRPLVDVTFWRAEIKLAKMRAPIALVERGLVVYK
jgi:hypothetical protein